MPADGEGVGQRRLMTKVAWLYHMRDMRQHEIARRLHLSQPRVSRLLRTAEENGIVRTVVDPPDGMFADLEDAIEARYGLIEAHVHDVVYDDEDELHRDLGTAAAPFIQLMLGEAETIGLTSWSRSVKAMVAAFRPARRSMSKHVVQMLGDLGHPSAAHEAALATQRLAELTGAEAVFLRTPGLARTPAAREAVLAHDPYVREAMAALDQLDLALFGVGTVGVVPETVRADEPFLDDEQVENVRRLGAAGAVNLRFIDTAGRPIDSPIDQRVIGVTLEQLRRAGRSVAVAGGASKRAAIRATLLGGWANVLVTDVATAEYLASSPLIPVS